MNTSAWQDYRLIWSASTTCRDVRSTKWTLRLALLAALAAGMARLAGVLERSVFWQVEIMIALLGFGMLWSMLFIPASILMNSAANARLVPRLRSRLLQMAGGGWAILVAGITLCLGSWTICCA